MSPSRGARLIGTAAARWMLAMLPLLGGASCSRRDAPAPTQVVKIALLEQVPEDAWWRRVQAGAARAARETGRVQIVARAAAVAGAGQAALVHDLVAERVDAIVLSPEEGAGDGLAAALREAVVAGVPLVLVDDHGDGPTAGIKAPRVLSNDGQAGVMAAEFLLKSLGGSGEVLVLGDGKGVHGSDKREIAFHERMARESTIRTVDAPPGPGPDRRRAAQLAVEYALDANRQVGAIFCPDEQSTLGVLRALRERSLAGRVRLVGVDTNPALVEAMAAGEIDALILRRPGEIGHRAMLAAIAMMKGEPVEDQVLTPVTLIAREVMHDKANMDLLLPDLSHADE